MKYKVLLIGASGRGKTYSFRNLDRQKTAFINVENKPLPFRGGFRLTSTPLTASSVIRDIEAAPKQSGIDCLVVDSFSAFQEMLMLESRATKTGWDIMNNYNEGIGRFNDAVKKCPIEVFVTAHWEVVSDEVGGQKERRVKVKGKEFEGMIEKDYTIALFTESETELGADTPTYHFRLYSDGKTSAKCPPDLFGKDSQGKLITSIDNDSALVLKKIREYQANP